MAHATSETPAPLTLHGLSVEGVNQCVHCGLCLASCPTFSELGTEMDSPRGRIVLIRSLAEGRIGLSDSTVQHLSLCLDCRACETVCPAGVPYGRLIEAAKAEIERQRPGGWLRRGFRWLNFGLLLGRPRLLALAAAGLRVYQVSGLQSLVRRSGLVRLLPGTLRAWEALLPRLPAAAEGAAPPAFTAAEGARRGRVAMLTGCIQSVVFGAHNRATARVLARNGWDVVAPAGQSCCGALNAHGGDHARALDMARRTIEAFEGERVDAVVVNTSGCGAHMKAYGTLLAEDPAWAERAALSRADHGHVSRPVSRRARPEDPHPAAHAAGADSRAAGRRPAGVGLVLRLGRHLQPHPAGDGRTPARAQGRPRREHGRADGRHRESR